MLAALRSRALAAVPTRPLQRPWKQPALLRAASSSTSEKNLGFLNLEEVEKVLRDVKADDVRVIPVRGQCDWTDFMVVATGRSTWHVRNIAQALIHKVKQNQKGSDRLLLPTVEGHEGGQWIVIDSGTVIIHALHDKARAYYNLESLWTTEMPPKGPNEAKAYYNLESLWTTEMPLKGPNEDLEKAIVKVRRKNNSKKPVKSAP